MPTLWRNALLIAMDDEHSSAPFRGDLLIDGDHIVAVHDAARDGGELQDDRHLSAATQEVDASGLLIHPGLVNAHTHSWEMLFRGTSERLPLELWSLISYPPLGVPPVPERLVHLRTMLAAIESLLGGTTSLLDDVGELPLQSRGSLRQVMDAYAEAGIRATCTGVTADVPLVDRLPFAEQVFDAETLGRSRAALPADRAAVDEYLAFSAEAVAYTEQFAGRIRYAMGPSAPHRVTDDLLVAAHRFAEEQRIVLHLHLLETKLQASLAAERWGTSAVQHLADLGVLSGNVTLAHGIWLTAEDRELLAAAGATVVHNPLSNLKLGSGRLAWRELHDAGVSLALGSDGASSNDTLNMLEVIKAAALIHTADEPDYDRWPSTDEVLRAATTGGAAALGQEGRIGRLVPGAKADLVVLDLTRSTAFTPLNSAARQLVYAENGSSIAQVWVDGRLIVEDGRCTLIDQDALLDEFRQQAARYLADFDAAGRRTDPYKAAVEAAYRRTWNEGSR